MTDCKDPGFPNRPAVTHQRRPSARPVCCQIRSESGHSRRRIEEEFPIRIVAKPRDRHHPSLHSLYVSRQPRLAIALPSQTNNPRRSLFFPFLDHHLPSAPASHKSRVRQPEFRLTTTNLPPSSTRQPRTPHTLQTIPHPSATTPPCFSHKQPPWRPQATSSARPGRPSAPATSSSATTSPAPGASRAQPPRARPPSRGPSACGTARSG